MMSKILIAGDGGQGVQLIAEVLCQTAFANNKEVSFIPNYGLEQRGGISLAYIQISDEKITYPKFSKPDILAIMSDQALLRTEAYQTPTTKLINVKDYGKLLADTGVDKKSWNVFLLGVLLIFLDFIDKEQVFQLLEKKLSRKPFWDNNKHAFEVGSASLNQSANEVAERWSN